MCGRITGQFITHNEASCTPHWDRIKYKVASSPHYPIDLSDLTLHIRKGCFHGQRVRAVLPYGFHAAHTEA